MESTRVILLRQARRRLRAAEARSDGIPDRLVAATVQVAVQVAQGKRTGTRVVSAGAMQLVRDALRALAEDRWRLSQCGAAPGGDGQTHASEN
jgi:hypothetical protein